MDSTGMALGLVALGGAVCFYFLVVAKRPSHLRLQGTPSERLTAVQAALARGAASPVLEGGGLVSAEGTTQALARAYSVTDSEDLRLLASAVGEIRVAQQSKIWLNEVRQTKYDEQNSVHERLLEDLWTAAFPDKRRAGGRHTSEWGELGFQGENPATDFRGGGVLSLALMVHLARTQPGLLRSILTEGSSEAHSTGWYMYAVSSINFTSDLLREFDPLKPGCQGCMGPELLRALSKFNPNALQGGCPPATSLPDHPVVSAFGDVQAEFAGFFHSQWVAKRPHVMEFNQFKDGLYAQKSAGPNGKGPTMGAIAA